MLLDFPAQLGDVFPSSGTASLVQLLDVARGLCAFVLRRCQLLKHEEDDVALKLPGTGVACGADGGKHTTMMLRIRVSRYTWSRVTRNHVRGAMQSNKKRAMAVRLSLRVCNPPPA